MKNQLQVFENEEFGKVRVLEIDGAPWFVGKDVADALGYRNTKDALQKHVDAEDRVVFQRSQNTTFEIPARGLTVINESGLYSLILSSKLPSAKKFKRWVTTEVLPSIRRHGAFVTDETLEKILESPVFAQRLFRTIAEERQKNAALLDKVERLAPKARYCDLILQCKTAVLASVIAKDYAMTAVAFNRLLHDLGVQYKAGGTWLLYQRHANRGYTKSKTYYTPGGSCVIHTQWTQKGRLFLYEILAAAGVYPMMESFTTAGFGEAWQ